MNKENFIVVDYMKCVGCGTCEMVCSLSHEDICSPTLSRMRVVRQEREGYNVPITCSECEKPACLNVCPVGAISRDKDSGMVVVDAYHCIGCRQCVRACPFGHMSYNFEKKTAFKCDLCGGDPQCVRFCWMKAIEYKPMDQMSGEKRLEAAIKKIEAINRD